MSCSGRFNVNNDQFGYIAKESDLQVSDLQVEDSAVIKGDLVASKHVVLGTSAFFLPDYRAYTLSDQSAGFDASCPPGLLSSLAGVLAANNLGGSSEALAVAQAIISGSASTPSAVEKTLLSILGPSVQSLSASGSDSAVGAEIVGANQLREGIAVDIPAKLKNLAAEVSAVFSNFESTNVRGMNYGDLTNTQGVAPFNGQAGGLSQTNQVVMGVTRALTGHLFLDAAAVPLCSANQVADTPIRKFNPYSFQFVAKEADTAVPGSDGAIVQRSGPIFLSYTPRVLDAQGVPQHGSVLCLSADRIFLDNPAGQIGFMQSGREILYMDYTSTVAVQGTVTASGVSTTVQTTVPLFGVPGELASADGQTSHGFTGMAAYTDCQGTAQAASDGFRNLVVASNATTGQQTVAVSVGGQLLTSDQEYVADPIAVNGTCGQQGLCS